MKSSIVKVITIFLFLFASQTLLADKPSWAGQGKPSAEEKSYHKKAMRDKNYDRDDNYKKEKKKKYRENKKKYYDEHEDDYDRNLKHAKKYKHDDDDDDDDDYDDEKDDEKDDDKPSMAPLSIPNPFAN